MVVDKVSYSSMLLFFYFQRKKMLLHLLVEVVAVTQIRTAQDKCLSDSISWLVTDMKGCTECLWMYYRWKCNHEQQTHMNNSQQTRWDSDRSIDDISEQWPCLHWSGHWSGTVQVGWVWVTVHYQYTHAVKKDNYDSIQLPEKHDPRIVSDTCTNKHTKRPEKAYYFNNLWSVGSIIVVRFWFTVNGGVTQPWDWTIENLCLGGKRFFQVNTMTLIHNSRIVN